VIEITTLQSIFQGYCTRWQQDYLLHMLARQQFCRVCGEPLGSARFDALTCSSTCRMRRYRGADLAYLADLPEAQAGARRFVHEVDLDAIATARSVCVARAEGRAQRRALPPVKVMKSV
jgi:hypothetical protein